MKITTPTNVSYSDAQAREDLLLFIQQPGPDELAVCPGCKEHIPAKCSANCNDTYTALSIDPERYPIERHVAAFIYELMATRVITTCWSCEGHMNEQNVLWKLPQVCFYASSPVYVKLLCRHLGELHQQKKTRYQWHIVINDFAQTNDLTYSIQPDLNCEADPHLGLLQSDLKVIADDLHRKLKVSAQKLLDNYPV